MFLVFDICHVTDVNVPFNASRLKKSKEKSTWQEQNDQNVQHPFYYVDFQRSPRSLKAEPVWLQILVHTCNLSDIMTALEILKAGFTTGLLWVEMKTNHVPHNN